MPSSSRRGARVTPSLLVRDLASTLQFHQRLGFAVTGRSEAGSPAWAEVRRDEAVIQFFTEAPHGVPDMPCLSGTLYFHPESVEALAAEWAGKVPFAWGPEVMPYGMRELAIQDPDGYFLAFTEPSGG